MHNYHDLLRKILDHGELISDERTGTGTIALFGESLSYDLTKGFPAITTKKLAWKSVVSELLWFLRGSSNVHELREILHGKENRLNMSKKTIWDDNYLNQGVSLGYTDGEMGDIYGVQWRNFGKEKLDVYLDGEDNTYYGCNEKISGVDQIKAVLHEARKNPSSRRLLVSAWNPKVVWDYNDTHVVVNKAALPPCHYSFQLNIVQGQLDMLWNQRSVDSFLGLSFNIASYALLQHIFARILGLNVRKLHGFLGNTHIYSNHIGQVEEQLRREHYELPELWINPELKTLEDFEKATVDDFKLIDYECHEAIKAKMAI